MRQRTFGLLMVFAVAAAAGCGARYTYTESDGRQLRVDRLTGRAEVMVKDTAGYHWRAIQEPEQHASSHAASERVRGVRAVAYEQWQKDCRARHVQQPPQRRVDAEPGWDAVRQEMKENRAVMSPPLPARDPCDNPYMRP